MSEEHAIGEESEGGRDPGKAYYVGRRAWLNFWKSLSLGVLSIVAGIWFWKVEDNLWILFGGLVVAVVIYGYVTMVRSMSLYVVTGRRAEIIYGLITKSSNEVRVRDIRTINVKKTGFKGLLGVGNVEFSSAGGDGAEVVFRDVWAAQRVKSLVRRLQDEAG